jgi:RHS repeat-associated protein
VKRHDYLPFGEELTAGAGGRTVAMGYGGGDGVRQQFTDKERDVETGLDYFYARYYASVQGRFINVDPLDINLKRQMTSDREAAATAFRNYIAQPQHWNRYAYALNNPLRYVDPDGSFEYPVTILGQTVMVNIDDDLAKDPVQLAKIQAALQAAIDKINSGETKLTKDQIESIHSMNKIQITKDPKKDNWREFRGTGTFGGTFYMNVYYVLNSTPHGLAGAIIHDSRHSEQIKRGLNYSKFTLPMEREASEFAIGVIYRIGGFPDSEIDVYEKDAVTGHLPAKGGNDKSSPEADRKVWNKMQEPQKPRN